MALLVFGSALGALFLYLAARLLDWTAFATASSTDSPTNSRASLLRSYITLVLS